MLKFVDPLSSMLCFLHFIQIYYNSPDRNALEFAFLQKATILFEQLYRAYRIIHNHPYHK